MACYLLCTTSWFLNKWHTEDRVIPFFSFYGSTSLSRQIGFVVNDQMGTCSIPTREETIQVEGKKQNVLKFKLLDF